MFAQSSPSAQQRSQPGGAGDSAFSADADRLAGQYLVFHVGHESYGVATSQVQEIRSYEAPTRLANAAEHIIGLMDLRGVVVPLVDLRICLRSATREYTPTTAVVILQVADKNAAKSMEVGTAAGNVNVVGNAPLHPPYQWVGGVVDGVADVVQLPASAIRPVPQLSHGAALGLVQAIAVTDGQMVFLMDANAVLGAATSSASRGAAGLDGVGATSAEPLPLPHSLAQPEHDAGELPTTAERMEPG